MNFMLLLSQVLLILLAGYTTKALQVNATIDDELGDSVTGALPVYSPQNVWSRGDECTTCFAKADVQQAFEHTWHDATWYAVSGPQAALSITMPFKGTALYAYCILDNAIQYVAFTNLTFFIDGSQVGTFAHVPDGTNIFQYNSLVYSNTSIPDGSHTFAIRTANGVNDSSVLFDYVEYTFDPSSASTTTSQFSAPLSTSSKPATTPSANSKSSFPVGEILGCLMTALVITALAAVWVLYKHRRSRKGHNGAKSKPLDEPPSTFGLNGAAAGRQSGWAAGQPVSSHSHSRSGGGSTVPFTAPSSDTHATPPPVPEKQPQSPTSALANAELNLGSAPYPPEKTGQGELSRRLETSEQRLAALESQRSIRYTSSNRGHASTPSASNVVNDLALEAQVDELKREVERLRQIMVEGSQAPPEYHD